MSTLSTKKTSDTYHHGNLRAELIRSAEVILKKEGLMQLSLRGVARRAGVSQTAPYRHFRDKAALLAAVAAGGFRSLATAMQAQLAQVDGRRGRMLEIGRGYLAFAIENRAVFRLMFGPEIPDKSAYPELRDAANAAFAVLANESSATAPSGTPDAAIAAWSFIHGLAMLTIDGQLRPETIGEAPIDALALTRRFGRFLDFSDPSRH